MAFFKNFRFGALFFCAKILFHLNWCNFSIRNGSTDSTPKDVYHFSAKFHRFGLRHGIFFKIFVSLLVLFLVPEFSLRKISATFRLEIGQWEGLPWRIIIFQRNSIVSISEIAFLKNSHFGARMFCAKIQFCLNWCNFSIGNGSTDRTP